MPELRQSTNVIEVETLALCIQTVLLVRRGRSHVLPHFYSGTGAVQRVVWGLSGTILRDRTVGIRVSFAIIVSTTPKSANPCAEDASELRGRLRTYTTGL